MKQLEVRTYVVGRMITLDGADNSDKGMFVLDCGGGDITPKNVSHFADGYFGRPKIFYATTKLNPLDKRKRDNLRKALGKIGSIELEEGKKIELIT